MFQVQRTDTMNANTIKGSQWSDETTLLSNLKENNNNNDNNSTSTCTRRDQILKLATSTPADDNDKNGSSHKVVVKDFDDGHIPENFALHDSASSDTNNNLYRTKLVQYPSFVDDRVATVHVVDDALPNALVDALYEVTVQEFKPWGTYVSLDQVQAYLDVDLDGDNSSNRHCEGGVAVASDRETLAVAAAARFLQNALHMSSSTSDGKEAPQNAHWKTYTASSKKKNNNKSPQLWTQDDHQRKAHGVAVWALASTESSQVPYHLDYAEQIRYEHNVIVPPLLAGTLQCSAVDMTGGDFCVCLDGLEHYEKHGYKGMKTRPQQQQELSSPNDTSTNTKPLQSMDFDYQKDTTAEWITVPYRYNRMILQSGHLPHLSTPVESMQPLPRPNDTLQTNNNNNNNNKAIKRVILGFNVFGHDYGALVQQAPEHSDVFRRKVTLQRMINSATQKNQQNNNNNSNSPNQRITLDALSANKGLSKLLVLAKREKIKRDLARAQRQLDQELEALLLETGANGVSVERLMTKFGTTDGQTWPSPVDVQVHIHHRISQASRKENTNDLRDNKDSRRRLHLLHADGADLKDGMVLSSSVIYMES